MNKALEWFGQLYIWCHSSASKAWIATSMLLYHGFAGIAFLMRHFRASTSQVWTCFAFRKPFLQPVLKKKQQHCSYCERTLNGRRGIDRQTRRPSSCSSSLFDNDSRWGKGRVKGKAPSAVKNTMSAKITICLRSLECNTGTLTSNTIHSKIYTKKFDLDFFWGGGFHESLQQKCRSWSWNISSLIVRSHLLLELKPFEATC